MARGLQCRIYKAEVIALPKVLISCAVTVHLTCAFVFAYMHIQKKGFLMKRLNYDSRLFLTHYPDKLEPSNGIFRRHCRHRCFKDVPNMCLLIPHECQLHAVKCSKSLDVNCNEYGKIMRHTCLGK